MDVSRARLWSVVVLSLLEISLFGGIQFGWSSILFIMKAEGVFRDRCSNATYNLNFTNSTTGISDGGNTCFNQDKQFNMMYSIGMVVISVSGVVCGQMLLRLGVMITRIISMLFFVAGVLLLGFTSVELPWLILPGFVLVGVGGFSLLLSNMQIAILLENHVSIYVGVLNGLYDSSVLTQRIIKKLFEDGIKRVYSYSAMAGLAIIISGVCTILFPRSSKIKQIETKNTKEVTENGKYVESHDTDNNNIELEIPQKELQNTAVENISLRETIFSRKYLLHAFWMSIMMLRFFYFHGSINRILEQAYSDTEKVSYFTDVLSYTMIAGLITSYMAGQVMHLTEKRYSESVSSVMSLSTTSGLASLASCLAFVTSDSSFYTTFIVMTVMRSFLFTSTMRFVIVAFPKRYMSFLFGLVVTSAGIISLLQYALFVWNNEYESASYHVNAVLLILSLLSLLHPLDVFLDSKRSKGENSKTTK